MSGQVILYDHEIDKVLDERRDHSKYVVKVATWNGIVVTAGWDKKVFIYHASGDFLSLGSPVAATTLSTNPETITFVEHPDSDRPILLVTRQDSTLLYYYSLELKLLGSQNLAPHSNSWITFTPSSIAVNPKDPTLLAVATSAVPHMKVIIVRLLLPPLRESPANISSPATQAAQTRSNLAIQDREEAAIQIHVSTMAPQTPYSTPQVVWRPHGTGVFVNGDDGVIRGLETKTGKIVSTLQGGHEVGSKIRSIWVCTFRNFLCHLIPQLNHKTYRGVEELLYARWTYLITRADVSKRTRNADCEIPLVWADRSRGREGRVACEWGI